ncbi:FAS1 domain-containing protein [Schizothecium vesticola]|uniref:FAS1 domain-containing protein n=1 Tax=Schizothecium vesticola TaxID=314040 RepID=A0AA40F1C9_9PEZI|nr:FAS1 domain-containing protein [Schizothecium vesticola]
MKALLILLAGLAAALVAPKAATRKTDEVVLWPPGQADQHDIPSSVDSWDALLYRDGFMRAIAAAEKQEELSIFDPKDDEHKHHDHDGDHKHPGHGHDGDHDHHTHKTIYQILKTSPHTTRFAALVDDHPEIIKLLNTTSSKNHTLLLPSDRAFSHIPPDHHRPPASYLLSLLTYHILPGLYPSHRLRRLTTAPTNLTLSSLGHHPQRLRLFTLPLPFSHTTINFHARITRPNVRASNGLIHILDALLLPPPPITKIFELLPGTFSTLSLALERTGLGSELEDTPFRGGVAFAPSNAAWRRLGPRANAFLFGTERGKECLKALVKYHLVGNRTVYSDEYYGEEKAEVEGHHGGGYWHVDVPSLLEERPLAVDVRKWKGLVGIVVNGRHRVVVRDGVAKDGVVQVLGSVLIPPHKGGDDGVVEGEIEVEELVERLKGWMGEEEEVGDL